MCYSTAFEEELEQLQLENIMRQKITFPSLCFCEAPGGVDARGQHRRLNEHDFAVLPTSTVYWLECEAVSEARVTNEKTWETTYTKVTRQNMRELPYSEWRVSYRSLTPEQTGGEYHNLTPEQIGMWTTSDPMNAVLAECALNEDEWRIIMRACLQKKLGGCRVLVRSHSAIFMPRLIGAECDSVYGVEELINKLLGFN